MIGYIYGILRTALIRGVSGVCTTISFNAYIRIATCRSVCSADRKTSGEPLHELSCSVMERFTEMPTIYIAINLRLGACLV